MYYVQNMNKYPKDRVKLQTGPRAPGRSLNKLRNKIMVALIPVHSLFSVRVSNVSKSGSVLMGENLLKEKSSPFTVSSSVTLRRDGQRNGCRKVWTAHATSTCESPKPVLMMLFSKWRYRNWFLLLAANRKWCGIKMGVLNRPTINNASQEDYLGSRRRQRECGKKEKSHTKVLDEVRVSGVEVWL